jgi:hypothetical protein
MAGGGGLTIRELITAWGFTVKDDALDRLDDKFNKLRSSVQLVGGFAVGAAASLFGMAKFAADAGDKAAKTAEKLGVNVEALQEYRYAADLAGVSNDAFDTSLKRFIKSIGEARSGTGDAKESLGKLGKTLGIDLVSRGKSAEDLLLDVSEAFSTLKDSTKKVEIATKLFGREGADLIPLLNQGSAVIRAQRNEARELGIVMSEDVTRAAEEFSDSQTRTMAVIKGLRNSIGAGLFPVLTRLSDRFRTYVLLNRQLISLRIQSAIDVMSRFIERATRVLMSMVMAVDRVINLFGGWENVLSAVGLALIAIMGLRFTSYLGELIKFIWEAITAFKIFGNTGLLAQMKIAAIPLLIGAAFIALILILEDIASYFKGNKSITGLIVNYFTKVDVGNKLTNWLESFLAKIKEFSARAGEYIVEGFSRAYDYVAASLREKMSNLSKPRVDDTAEIDASFVNMVKNIWSVLETAFNVSAIPLKIGWAIADGMIEGMIAGIKKRFPKLAEFLGIGDEIPVPAFGMPKMPTDIFDKNAPKMDIREIGKRLGIPTEPEISPQLWQQKKGQMGQPLVTPMFEQKRGQLPGGMPINQPLSAPIIAPSISVSPPPVPIMKPAISVSTPPIPAPIPPMPLVVPNITNNANRQQTQVINLNANNQITVPPGTPPEQTGKIITDSLRQSLTGVLNEGLLRETARNTKPAVEY